MGPHLRVLLAVPPPAEHVLATYARSDHAVNHHPEAGRRPRLLKPNLPSHGEGQHAKVSNTVGQHCKDWGSLTRADMISRVQATSSRQQRIAASKSPLTTTVVPWWSGKHAVPAGHSRRERALGTACRSGKSSRRATAGGHVRMVRSRTLAYAVCLSRQLTRRRLLSRRRPAAAAAAAAAVAWRWRSSRSPCRSCTRGSGCAATPSPLGACRASHPLQG